MIRKLLYRILAPRHPWRRVDFSELSEMYLTGFLRTFAIGMVGIFLPIYLHKLGYSLTAILGYYVIFYAVGLLADYIVAHLIAYSGPKHVMRVSFLLQALFALVAVNIQNIPFGLPILAVIGCFASTAYFIPYNVDFSKVKHREHGGKEVGIWQLLEKCAGIIGPLAGGALATYVMPSATFIAAGVAMLIAAIVLMLSPEPVQTRQKLRFKGLKPARHWHAYAAFAFFCGENMISIIIWPIFLSFVVFKSNVFLNLGFVTSISVLVAALVTMPLGRLLDNQKGRAMITYGTAVNACVHLLRLLVTNVAGCLFVAVLNEPNTMVYRLAFIKGYYDEADDYPGYRIAFLTFNEICADLVRLSVFVILMILSLHLSAYFVCSVAFVLAALFSFLIRLERFAALKA